MRRAATGVSQSVGHPRGQVKDTGDRFGDCAKHAFAHAFQHALNTDRSVKPGHAGSKATVSSTHGQSCGGKQHTVLYHTGCLEILT